jgi:glutamyl-Q tRNA(Asp) synthetase
VSSTEPILRFAPSPNGRLHLGHAYSALYTAHWADRLGGRFLLRIEDIDITRCKPEFTDAIFEDLHWLGLDWPEPVLVQSQRFDVYAAHARQLAGMGLLYPCFCSRAEVAAAATGTDPDGAPLYAGTCRHLSQSERAERLSSGHPDNWRLDSAEAIALTGPLTFTAVQPTPLDRPQIRYARPERWGDVVIQRQGTPTSYHLSVVVDDAEQGVTYVTRGRDMEPSTDIHILLQFLLGLRSPIYNFHKLLLDDRGKKLAKSKGSPSLASLRDVGWTPEAIRKQLGF